VLDADLLLRIYAAAAFPMWNAEEGEIHLFRPDPRAVLEFESLHVPRRLARTLRRGLFRITTDRAFDRVLDECHRERRDGCWCSPEMTVAYLELHERGFAHSVEAWRGDVLVGGLYGVHLGAAFMAESMFSRPRSGGTDASKVVLVETVRTLARGGFEVFDVQFQNDHIEQFGVVEISAGEYQTRFERAALLPRDWPSFGGEADQSDAAGGKAPDSVPPDSARM
jgi:leucyl/phenylalanyl-tRNA--protein transferase